MVQERAIVICGLPESGKTTFLAALWHLITEREIPTKLSFHNLRDGDSAYLNEIATRWRGGKVQERTSLGVPTLVAMNLLDQYRLPVRLTIPDLNGESYRRMWEDRECDIEVAKILKERTGVMLFIHADRIQPPQWTADVAALSAKLGLKVEPGKPVPWHPRLAPTQVQVIEVLQFLRREPLDIGPRRLAIMLSAWDKVAPEGRTPSDFLAERMPLLHQYLSHGELGHEWRVFGVSAQGCDYEPRPEAKVTWSREQRDEFLKLDRPSERITLVSNVLSHDITEPIAWLTD